MGNLSRRSGLAYENRIAAELRELLSPHLPDGYRIRRNIQFRGGACEGPDIDIEPMKISLECKCQKAPIRTAAVRQVNDDLKAMGRDGWTGFAVLHKKGTRYDDDEVLCRSRPDSSTTWREWRGMWMTSWPEFRAWLHEKAKETTHGEKKGSAAQPVR